MGKKVNYIQIFDDFMDDVLADTNNEKYPRTIVSLVKYIEQIISYSDEYYFDEDQVQKTITIMSMFPMTKGKYSRMKFGECILDWQVFFIGCIYGIKKKSDNTRRFRQALLLIARKNGKSALASAIMLYNYLFDGEGSPECYSVAGNADQASIVFKTCSTMLKGLCEQSPAIKTAVDVRRYDILKKNDSEAMLRYLASNAHTLDGLGASTTVFDEVHAYKDSDMVDVMRSGSGHRSQPLMLFVTTAGFVLEGFLHGMYKTAKDLLGGYVEDSTMLPMIWELDPDDDYNNSDMWYKANPASRAGVVSVEWLQNEYQTAKNNGDLNGFRTKNLNQFVAGAETWVEDAEWKKCNWKIKDEDLLGKEVFVGLDLSSTNDITALGLFFPEQAVFKHYSFFPSANIDTYGKKNKAVYKRLESRGELILTPGNVVNYDHIQKVIDEVATKYNVQLLAYDRWNSSQLVISLNDSGLECLPMLQNFSTLGPIHKEMTTAFMKQEISHQDSEMINWQRGNIILETNFAGLQKIDKRKSSNKIDTIVALQMAYGAYLYHLANAEAKSRYEDDDANVYWF